MKEENWKISGAKEVRKKNANLRICKIKTTNGRRYNVNVNIFIIAIDTVKD